MLVLVLLFFCCLRIFCSVLNNNPPVVFILLFVSSLYVPFLPLFLLINVFYISVVSLEIIKIVQQRSSRNYLIKLIEQQYQGNNEVCRFTRKVECILAYIITIFKVTLSQAFFFIFSSEKRRYLIFRGLIYCLLTLNNITPHVKICKKNYINKFYM